MLTLMNTLSTALLLTVLLISQAGAADVTTLIKDCEGCHGNTGVSQWDDMPTIAGISAPVHRDYLLAYQEKTRPCSRSRYRQGDTSRPETDMCAIAAKLSSADAGALADYFSGRAFVAAKQSFDGQKAATGKNLHARDCEKCHANGGRDPADDASILGGQHLKYLQQALADFKARKRAQPKKMGEKLAKWTDAELDAVVHYYASLQ